MRRQAPGICPEERWDRLMRPCTPRELLDVLSEASGDKAPGQDGVTIDILKLATGASGNSPDLRGPILSFLVSLVNACLRTGCCPPTLKAGIIVMIPKPGAPANDASNMRPITLLPELGKITPRTLAKRVTLVLHDKPDILCAAQRAYLMDGSSRQSLAALLDTIEDFQECRLENDGLELVVTSYDIRKAFDSVQHFTIQASCERLNLPEPFIRYLLGTLQGAESRVRCADGLTEPFTIMSSVRQGDPLAALVFIFVMDALHTGLRTNPLGPVTPGYTLRHGPTVHSLGYSDDTATVADSWDGATMQHSWICEFLVANHMSLNSSKSHCVIGSGRDTTDACPLSPTRRCLRGVRSGDVHDPAHRRPAGGKGDTGWDHTMYDARYDIATKKPSQPFRYLGYLVRVDLGSGAMISSIAFKIRNACSMIRSHKLNLIQAADVLREYLYPRIDMGLTHASISDAQLQRWESLIRWSVLHIGHDLSTRSISGSALYASLGVLPLGLHTRMLRVSETGVMLRGGLSDSTATAAARLQVALDTRRVTTHRKRVPGQTLDMVRSARSRAPISCRVTGALRDALSAGHTMAWPDRVRPLPFTFPAPGVFHPEIGCNLLPGAGSPGQSPFYCLQPSYSGQGLVAFTDGSFTPSDGRPGSRATSGSAIIICKAEDIRTAGYDFHHGSYVILSCTAPISGANYTAEVKALYTLLHAVPLNVPLLCASDALSALQAMWKPAISRGGELRLGARSFTLPARSLLRMREALRCPSLRTHVHSHTGSNDVMSRGNALADHYAGLAAGPPCHPALTHDHHYTFWKDDGSWHVSGDLRRSLRDSLTRVLIERWKRTTSAQGEVLRSAKATHSLLCCVRKTRDHLLFTFFTKAITRQLSTADKLFPGLRRLEVPLLCPLCGGPEDHLHPFVCPSNMVATTAMTAKIRSHLRTLCAWIGTSGVASVTHSMRLRTLPDHAHFFDFNARLSDPAHDPYGGILGVLPHGFRTTLLPNAAASAPEALVKKIRGLLGGRILTFQLATIREAMTAYHTWERAATPLRQRPTLDPLIPPSPSRDVELGGDVGGETRVRCRRRGQKRGAIGEDAKLGSTSNTRIRRKRSLAPVKRGRPHAGGRTDFHNTSSPQGHDVPPHGTRGGNRAGGGSSPEVPQPPPKRTRVELVMGTDSHKHGHSRRCSLFEDFSLFFSPLPRGVLPLWQGFSSGKNPTRTPPDVSTLSVPH